MPQISHLECSRCHNSISADTPQTLCPQCAGALYVRYELSSAQGTAVRDRIASEAARKWRFAAADQGSREWVLRFEFGRDGTTVRAVGPRS